MMPPSSRPQTNITTELAKQRNRAAAERTLLTWIQHSLTLLGLGIAIERIYATLLKAFPNADRIMTGQVSDMLGLSLIVLGLGLLALAIRQYKISTRSIQRQDYTLMSSRPMILTATTGVVLFGIVSAIILLFRSL